MSSHRADKRALPRRRSGDSSSPDGATGRASRARSAGKRKAVKPRRRVGHLTSTAVRDTPADARQTVVPAIFSVPTLVGAAAMALAAAGAVSVSAPVGSARLASGGVAQLSAQTGALHVSGGGLSSSLRGRARAVSRDSRREALQDAEDRQLQAAAEKRAKERNAALARLSASAQKQASLLARSRWQLPVGRGAYHLTSRFGDCSSLWSHCHTGLDFAAPVGTPIRAVATGKVTETAYSGAYGNRTIVRLGDGSEMWYCHQTSFAVKRGQQVRPGQVIGSVGATGNVTGPHLHFEVRPHPDKPVDPEGALRGHGLRP